MTAVIADTVAPELPDPLSGFAVCAAAAINTLVDVPDAAIVLAQSGNTADPAVLAEQLAQVRNTGIASEVEEAVLGECGLAATVFDTTEQPAGAIGLVVPAARWPLAPEAVDALRDTARAVSRELGAPVWPPRR
mgnify:FL=1